jgi:hypothetical protein
VAKTEGPSYLGYKLKRNLIVAKIYAYMQKNVCIRKYSFKKQRQHTNNTYKETGSCQEARTF